MCEWVNVTCSLNRFEWSIWLEKHHINILSAAAELLTIPLVLKPWKLIALTLPSLLLWIVLQNPVLPCYYLICQLPSSLLHPDKCLKAGDWNIHTDDISESFAFEFLNTVESFNCTHKLSPSLDLVFYFGSGFIILFVRDIFISDHLCLVFNSVFYVNRDPLSGRCVQAYLMTQDFPHYLWSLVDPPSCSQT